MQRFAGLNSIEGWNLTLQLSLFWRFGTFLVLTLIFHPHHAILTPVTKIPKNQGLTRVSPIPGVRSYTYSICLPRHSSDVHASMDARLIAARK